MKTRSRPAAKPTQAESDPPSNALAPSEPNPPKLFILPKGASADARIISLPNPATSTPNRYYFCPEKGFYEFTKIAAPRNAPRSWLLVPSRDAYEARRAEREKCDGHETEPHKETASHQGADADTAQDPSTSAGYIARSADLFVAAPIDPLFLMLPALAPPPTSSKDSQKQLFLSLDDHLDNLSAASSHLRQLLRRHDLNGRIEQRVAAVCETVDAGDEKMYRLSPEKLLQELLAKAQRMAANRLPASMEEHFVQKVMHVPIMSVKREDSSVSAAPVGGTTDAAAAAAAAEADSQRPTAEAQESAESQTTVPTTATPLSRTSPATAPPLSAPEPIQHLLRLRTALSFLLSSYTPPHLRSALHTALSNSRPIDFAPLDAHLARLAALKADAHALRAMSDNVSRKRAAADGDEAAEARAEKKRRKEEEEERRKRLESRGVKVLRKADTSGMKKLSAFFGKAPAKEKAV